MTKLTTERLEKLQDDLLQFQDHYSDPADKENYNIFVDALHVIDEFKAAKEKLLAYEQAAEHPAARITWDGSEFSVSNVSEDFLYGGTAVYLAPVLPKQPVKPVMFIDGDISSDDAEKLAAVIREFGNEPAPAQPVIPRKWTIFNAVSFIAEYKPTSYEEAALLAWNACRAEVLKAQQNEPQNNPAQPVSEPKATGYFSYGTEHGFNWHQTAKQATDDAEAMIEDYRGDACDGWPDETDSVCWGVVLQQATKVDERPRTNDDKCDPAIDMVCEYALLPELVGNSPVIPEGWKLVPIEPTAEMYEAGDKQITTKQVWDSMLAAAPTAQERE